MTETNCLFCEEKTDFPLLHKKSCAKSLSVVISVVVVASIIMNHVKNINLKEKT